MSTGKRRANWETVLEERMVQQQLLISNLNMDRLNQITDLQNEIKAMKEKTMNRTVMMAIMVLLAILTAVLK